MVLRSLEEFPNLGLLVYPGGDESFWLKKDKAETEKRRKEESHCHCLFIFLFKKKITNAAFYYNSESVMTKFHLLDEL